MERECALWKLSAFVYKTSIFPQMKSPSGAEKERKTEKRFYRFHLKFRLPNTLKKVKKIHESDRADGFGAVRLPSALEKNIPMSQKTGTGNEYFRKYAAGKTSKPASRGGITPTRR